jgi:hypothetical protein
MGFRLYQVASTDFPVGDGGLFYNMIENIKDNRFALPNFATYNGSVIPFAYPPLSFYLIALISRITGLPTIEIMRWFAPLCNGLCILAIFVFARAFFKSDEKAALSALFFALAPANFFYLSAGGGVARSLGLFFAIPALAYLYLAYTVGSKRQIVLCGVFCALAVLSHPVAGQFVAYTGLLLFLFFGRSKKGVLASIYVGIITLILLLPWLIPVIARHGIAIFGYAFLTSPPWLSFSEIGRYLLSLNYLNEGGINLFAFLAVIGMVKCVIDRKLFLPTGFFVMLYLMARSPNDRNTVIVPLLSTIATVEVIVPTAAAVINRIVKKHIDPRYALAIIVVIICVYGSITVLRAEQINIRSTLSQADREAMAWANTNTPKAAEFLVFDKIQSASVDTVLEWFPALSGRRSPTVPFGQEWVGFKRMSNVTNYYDNLRQCSNQGITCIENLAKIPELQYDYIYISTIDYSDQWKDICCSVLLDSLQRSPNYALVYDNREVQVFRRLPNRLEF